MGRAPPFFSEFPRWLRWACRVAPNADKRLHHNVLAIALANKLARITWAVLAKGRIFEATRTMR